MVINHGGYREGDWYRHFKDRMDMMGFQAPAGFFGSFKTAMTTAGELVSGLHMVGKTATVGEIVGATITIEKIGVAATVYASYYVGVVVASMMYASDQKLRDVGYNVTDFQVLMDKSKINLPGYNEIYHRYPQIQKKQLAYRWTNGRPIPVTR